jgi:toxin ParE1/3/4
VVLPSRPKTGRIGPRRSCPHGPKPRAPQAAFCQDPRRSLSRVSRESNRVHQREAARRDLIEQFLYLAEEAGIETAERFLYQAEASFKQLAEHPKMGSPLTLRPPELAGLRKWRVREFDDHLIFYLPRADGVSIVRMLHAARDCWRLTGIETDGVGEGATTLQLHLDARQTKAHTLIGSPDGTPHKNSRFRPGAAPSHSR